MIERVLGSNLLHKALTFVPDRGATDEELSQLAKTLSRTLSVSHVSLLKRWNGINLEVIRVYGASPTIGELRGLKEAQTGPLISEAGAIVFADDPSGFVYAETQSGEIISLDSSYGDIEEIASGLDDFFERLVFGKDAGQFLGEEWLTGVANAGLTA